MPEHEQIAQWILHSVNMDRFNSPKDLPDYRVASLKTIKLRFFSSPVHIFTFWFWSFGTNCWSQCNCILPQFLVDLLFFASFVVVFFFWFSFGSWLFRMTSNYTEREKCTLEFVTEKPLISPEWLWKLCNDILHILHSSPFSSTYFRNVIFHALSSMSHSEKFWISRKANVNCNAIATISRHSVNSIYAIFMLASPTAPFSHCIHSSFHSFYLLSLHVCKILGDKLSKKLHIISWMYMIDRSEIEMKIGKRDGG